MNRLALISCLLCLSSPAAPAADPCPPPGPATSGHASAPERHVEEDIAAVQAAIVAGVDPSMKLPAPAAGPAYQEHPYLTGGHFGADSEDCR